MWTGKRCCKGKCPHPSSRPSVARKMSATLTRSSPLKCRRSHLHGSLVCSPGKNRRASGTLTMSLTSARGPRGSLMLWMFDLDSIVTVVPKQGDCLYWLSIDCLSANNYTVNEWICLVKDWDHSSLNRWFRGQNIVSELKENESPPPQSSPNTSDLCIMQTFAFKTPPPVMLCVGVVTCAGARGGARCLFVPLTVWVLLLMAAHTNALHLYLY